MNEKERCSSNNTMCNLAISNSEELDLEELEKRIEQLKKDIKKIKIERKPILTPYIVCLLILGIFLIVRCFIGG